MAVRSFIPWPDRRLKTPAKPVEAVSAEVQSLWDDMIETMYAMPGVGLAAPQIGVMLRIAVIDCSPSKDAPVRMANPDIIHQSEKFADHDEGSPNLPGVHANISRPRAVTVSFLDSSGVRIRKDFVGLWAASVQHQIDHLNGKMYFDHLSPVKRKMLLAKSVKRARRAS